MNMQIDSFYTENLNELKALEHNADVSDMELFTNTIRSSYRTAYDFAVYTFADEKYFIVTANGVHEMALRNIRTIDNEVNLHRTTMRFEFTPDNLHIWSVEVTKNDLFDWHISSIEAISLPASDNYVHAGDSVEYNGIRLTFNAENSVTISKGDKTFTMKVKEDYDSVYHFLKRTIRARYGAYGLFSFMENIVEQAKIHCYPFWNDSYMIMERFVA